MSFIATITFMDVCLALLALAMSERCIIPHLPQSLVGPNGVLLKTSA